MASMPGCGRLAAVARRIWDWRSALCASITPTAHELRNEMEGILSRVLKAEAYAELDMVAL